MIKKILVKIGQNWSKFGVDLKTRFSPVVFDQVWVAKSRRATLTKVNVTLNDFIAFISPT